DPPAHASHLATLTTSVRNFVHIVNLPLVSLPAELCYVRFRSFGVEAAVRTEHGRDLGKGHRRLILMLVHLDGLHLGEESEATTLSEELRRRRALFFGQSPHATERRQVAGVIRRFVCF